MVTCVVCFIPQVDMLSVCTDIIDNNKGIALKLLIEINWVKIRIGASVIIKNDVRLRNDI
jgi:hypothetical protein